MLLSLNSLRAGLKRRSDRDTQDRRIDSQFPVGSPNFAANYWLHVLLLLSWTAIATALRFTNLTLKPVWTDEFSTLVFSLGNSFLTIPLDHPISAAELLQPLQPNPQVGIGAVSHNLLRESNHPSLYFIFSHLWLKLFPAVDGLVSVWAARALPALLGVLSVPATFCLGWLASRSLLVGQLSAALMAVSPFGIYLAQEARHYTLATLWITASLSCLVVAVRFIWNRRPVPIWLCLTWVIVNCLGIATHYFVAFTLLSEAIALLLIWLTQSRFRQRQTGDRTQELTTVSSPTPHSPSPLSGMPDRAILPISPSPSSTHLWRLSVVPAGTLAGSLVWLPTLLTIQESELTRWIQQGDFEGIDWLDPLLRTLAGWTTMLYLLPIQGVPSRVAIACGIGLGALTVWTLLWVYRGFKVQSTYSNTQLGVQTLGALVGGGIALSFIITYGFNIDVASVFRYQFFYFPAAIVLLGAGLANCWEAGVAILLGLSPSRTIAKRAVVLVGVISLLGGLTVVSNLGYQKTHRPDGVAQAIQQSSQHPALITIPHNNHGQTGRLMGIALELQRNREVDLDRVQFLLAHHRRRDPQPAIAALQRTLEQLPRPLDVWRVNFRDKFNPLSHETLQKQGCVAQSKLRSVDGYRYQHYACARKGS